MNQQAGKIDQALYVGEKEEKGGRENDKQMEGEKSGSQAHVAKEHVEQRKVIKTIQPEHTHTHTQIEQS